jgi:hypothetical protein
MIKSTGIGIGPKLIQTQETEAPATVAPPVQSSVQDAAPLTSAANTSIRAESQLSASALYAELNSRFNRNNASCDAKAIKPQNQPALKN